MEFFKLVFHAKEMCGIVTKNNASMWYESFQGEQEG